MGQDQREENGKERMGGDWLGGKGQVWQGMRLIEEEQNDIIN